MARLRQDLFERVLHSEYYRYQPTTVHLQGAAYQVVTKMGLSGWPEEDYAARLLAANVRLQPGDQVAVVGCGDGLVAIAASAMVPEGQVFAVDADYVAVEATRHTVELNQAQNVSVHLCDGTMAIQDRTFDAVLVKLPKGRELVHQLLVDAHRLLVPGGQLYLAGANQAGIKGYGRVLEQVFQNARVLAYRKGHRVLQATKTGVADSASTLSPSYYVVEERHLEARGAPYTVLTKPGIFAWDRLDPGSAVLLETMHVDPGDTVLDLGCGFGIVGLVAARLAPHGQVYAVDANITAVHMAARTFQHNRVGNATAMAGDVTEPVRQVLFDVVATNPPFHAGVEAEFVTALAFIAGSAQVLKPGGRLYLVANRFIKYEPYLEQLFTRVETAYQDNRFKVLQGLR